MIVLRLGLVAALAALFALVSPASAQLTLPTAAPAPAVSGAIVSGPYVTAPIVLDGSELIRIGAQVNAPVTALPIALRVADVQTVLAGLLAERGSPGNAAPVFDPATLRIHVEHAGDVDLLTAVDAKHSDPLPIVTVTNVDARANGVTNVNALATQWQATLQSALVRALQIRQPAAERRGLQDVRNVAIVLIAISLVVAGVLRVLWQRMERLESEVAERARATDVQTPHDPEHASAGAQRRRFFAVELRNLEPTQRLRVYGAGADSLVWALALAWFIALVWGLSRFAETTPLARSITTSAYAVATTVIATGLLNRVLDIVIARAAAAWRLRRFANSEDRARLLLRIPTIARAVSGAKAFVLIFIAVLSICGQVGVPIGSVVTIGGLAAIALSLAAQNFVRDFLNGFLVLFEDQYVVGDYVTINAFSGSVEHLTLRMVQIRDAAGDLITIPHSSVVNVVNQSRNWSRIDFRVAVDAGADIAQAIDIVRSEIEALVGQGDWTAGIATPLEWIGVDALSRDGIVVRASIQTAPLRQFELRRRLNERVRLEFARAGVALGAPPA